MQCKWQCSIRRKPAAVKFAKVSNVQKKSWMIVAKREKFENFHSIKILPKGFSENVVIIFKDALLLHFSLHLRKSLH